jgi:hypothetical protein
VAGLLTLLERKIMEKTPVAFRWWKDQVIAIFPTLPGTNDPGTCQSYQRIGQHGSCDPAGIVADSRPANEHERLPLELELKRIGYDLRLVRRPNQRRYFELRRKEVR